VYSLGGLNTLKIGARCQASLGGGGLILSHEACGMVMDAVKLSELQGPLLFRIRGRVFGQGV